MRLLKADQERSRPAPGQLRQNPPGPDWQACSAAAIRDFGTVSGSDNQLPNREWLIGKHALAGADVIMHHSERTWLLAGVGSPNAWWRYSNLRLHGTCQIRVVLRPVLLATKISGQGNTLSQSRFFTQHQAKIAAPMCWFIVQNCPGRRGIQQ